MAKRVLEAWGRLWPPHVMEEAKACVVGLEYMLSRPMSPSAVSRQEPLVAWHPRKAEHELNVMICVVQVGGSGKDATVAIPCADNYGTNWATPGAKEAL